MLKNITLSAEQAIIQRAREKALKNKTTLNNVFREWLKNYVKTESNLMDYSQLMNQLKHIKPGKHFTREDFNER